MKRIYLIIGVVVVSLVLIAIAISLYTNRKGSLLIQIAPNDSQVRIDGGNLQRVDKAFYIDLSKGKHNVLVRKEGYIDSTQTVEIKSGKQEIIEVTLQENPKQNSPTASNTPITKTSQSSPTSTTSNQTNIAQTNQNITANQYGTTNNKITNIASLKFQGDLGSKLVAANNAIKDVYYFSEGTWAVVVFINPAIQPSQSTKGIFQLNNNSWNQVAAPTEIFNNSIKDLVPLDLYNFLYQNNMVISR